jgi:hypothetical protein
MPTHSVKLRRAYGAYAKRRVRERISVVEGDGEIAALERTPDLWAAAEPQAEDVTPRMIAERYVSHHKLLAIDTRIKARHTKLDTDIKKNPTIRPKRISDKKREAIRKSLKRYPQKSRNWIAKRHNVTPDTVNRIYNPAEKKLHKEHKAKLVGSGGKKINVKRLTRRGVGRGFEHLV